MAAVAARSVETIRAQAVKAAVKMARLAGLLAGGKRKNRRFRHGAVEKPARKEQRKEEQAMDNAHKQLARSQYRQEQIAILSHAVHNGTCSDMLVPLDDDLNVGSDISRAQATRAQIQCMVVLEFFRLLEVLAQENGGELPGGSVYELAAQAGVCAALGSLTHGGRLRRVAKLSRSELRLRAAGPRGTPGPAEARGETEGCVCRMVGNLLGLGLSEVTVRRYYYQWIHNDSQFLRDQRGKYSRELIVNEEDVGNRLRKWARKNEDKPHFVDNAAKFINETLLPGLPAGMLAEYNIKLPVARSTAHRWLAAADIRRGWATQNYYNDNHQAPLVIKQREEYIPVRKELELRQPLWIQLTGPQREAMERRATAKYEAKRAEEEERKRTRKPKYDRKGRAIVPDDTPLQLPTPHYVYQDGTRESVRTMYEYHVDDAECFLDWRMTQRLGGSFSKGACMPAEGEMT